MNSAKPPRSPPSIAICISTSTRTLDLSLDTPLTISVVLTLNSTHPVTFRKHSTPLLNSLLYTNDLMFKPVLRASSIAITPGMTADQIQKLQDQRTNIRKWMHVAGLEDGQTYEIGVNKDAGVSTWMIGTLEENLAMRESGLTPKVRREVLEFKVRETTSFDVKRPDRDGSLTWP